jgi:hypothetical protein
MTSADSLILVSAIAGSCAVALAGWLLEVRTAREPLAELRPSSKWRRAVTVCIVLGAGAAAIAAPVVAVLWIVVGLNFLLGARENVPFSTYAMFSQPRAQTWTLRFEDCDGHLVVIGKIGLAPHVVQKRFATELRVARERGVKDLATARRTAAAVLAALLEQHRPSAGPLATAPITIVLVEYVFESGKLRTVKTPIMEARPR